MGLDKKKIAFITCINDETEYAECRYYLDRLVRPEGYAIDMIGIREAPSMAAGYNAGMRSSDAKYKVYLHQDVFIRNIHFLEDILNVFEADERIGMIGMIGKRSWEMIDGVISSWDVGKLIDNDMLWNAKHPTKEELFTEVQSADGLLLATRYDIPWREDIFDGWDFYDHSQCVEFKKAGYKVVVPWQREPWCYHDDLYSNMTAYYDHYAVFKREYARYIDLTFEEGSIDEDMYKEKKAIAQGIEDMRAGLEELINAGAKLELRRLFQAPLFQGLRAVAEYRAIVCIDQQEEQEGTMKRFWDAGMPASWLVSKLRMLKYALKRIEYGADDLEKDQIWEDHSKIAIEHACDCYVMDKDKIYEKLGKI